MLSSTGNLQLQSFVLVAVLISYFYYSGHMTLKRNTTE